MPARLTEEDRRINARACEVGVLPPDGYCGFAGTADEVAAAVYVLGMAKDLLLEQAAIIRRLSGEDGSE